VTPTVAPTATPTAAPTVAPTPGAPPPTSSGYGTGIAADDLANTQIGGTDNGPTTRVAYRFFTAGGTLTAIHPYFETGSGYSGGTGGTRRIELTTDTGTVLASTTYSGLTRFPVIPLSATIPTGAYRIVFTNIDPNAGANFVSANALFVWDVMAQPKYPGWQVLWDFGSGWQVRSRYLPILQLDGLPEGIGYMEAWQRTQPLIGGNAKVRERFTPSRSMSIGSVMVRLSRTGTGSSPLTVRLMQGSTTVASGTIPATSFPNGTPSDTSSNHNGWGTATLSASLLAGTVYDLLLTSPADTTFHAEAIREGEDYGFSAHFSEGRMQSSTDGTTFTDLPAPYGGNAGQGDLQFYFK
jgi:hypothetical protein